MKQNGSGFRIRGRHIPSIVVWLVAVGGVVYLLNRPVWRLETTGIAQAEQRAIVAESAGRLSRIGARLFDPIRLGQVLAAIDEDRPTDATTARAGRELTSPLDGTVSQLHRLAGDVVQAGEPILTVTAKRPSEIAVYARDRQVANFREGATVELARLSGNQPPVRSRVIRVGTVIEPIPARLWKNSTSPEWGQAIMVAIPEDMKLIPGELVTVRVW